MYLEQKIKGILDRLSPSLGGEDMGFELLTVQDGVLEVGLLLGPKACVECVMPDEILETILLKEVRKDLPIIREVKVRKTANRSV